MSEEVEEEEVEAPVAAHAPREVLTWKTKAVRLYESRQVAREQGHKLMLDKQLFQFKEGLSQLLGKEYEVDALRAEIDGVTFVGYNPGTQGSTIEVNVEFRCKACGGVQQQHVRGLADIGAILAGAAEPHENCPAVKKAASDIVELTPAEKLIEAFRNFLASELEEVDETA